MCASPRCHHQVLDTGDVYIYSQGLVFVAPKAYSLDIPELEGVGAVFNQSFRDAHITCTGGPNLTNDIRFIDELQACGSGSSLLSRVHGSPVPFWLFFLTPPPLTHFPVSLPLSLSPPSL